MVLAFVSRSFTSLLINFKISISPDHEVNHDISWSSDSESESLVIEYGN